MIRRDYRYFYIGKVPRKRSVLEETLAERGDPKGMFSAEITVDFRIDEIDLPPQPRFGEIDLPPREGN